MDAQKPIVVAIDDQPAILHTIASELRDQYQVRPFTSGQGALKFLETQSIDLILLDYDMPGMNGCEMLERLQADNRMSGVPVIFLTGSIHGDTEVEVLEKGAADYIQKPIKARVLQTRVRIQLELARYRNHMETLVRERTTQLQTANEKLKIREDITLSLLAEVTDLRDHDTGGHIRRTTEMVRILTQELLYTQKEGYIITHEEADEIIRSAKLHDLGKIAVPDKVLLKPGKLDDDEFAVIKQHPTHGGGLLEKYIARMGEDSFLDTAKNIALYHHEKWNGLGYPCGLKGGAIPLSARVTAIADVYDALTSARPYKEPFSHERSAKIIAEESGTHFDPYLIELFHKNEAAFAEIVKNTRLKEDF